MIAPWKGVWDNAQSYDVDVWNVGWPIRVKLEQ